MIFKKLDFDNENEIKEMSDMASEIVLDYYTPLLGIEQNSYMVKKFQSVEAIKDQHEHGYTYYFVKDENENLGFVAYYPKEHCLYLSKFYLYKEKRGKGYAREILRFLQERAKEIGFSRIELNVNKYNETKNIYERLGFTRIRSEKIDIGNGFFMDDFVYAVDF